MNRILVDAIYYNGKNVGQNYLGRDTYYRYVGFSFLGRYNTIPYPENLHNHAAILQNIYCLLYNESFPVVIAMNLGRPL